MLQIGQTSQALLLKIVTQEFLGLHQRARSQKEKTVKKSCFSGPQGIVVGTAGIGECQSQFLGESGAEERLETLGSPDSPWHPYLLTLGASSQQNENDLTQKFHRELVAYFIIQMSNISICYTKSSEKRLQIARPHCAQ